MKPPPKPAPGDATANGLQRAASALFGCWLAIVPAKFGNPVIFEHKVAAPEGFYDFVLSSWPVSWSYGALGMVAIATLLVWRRTATVPRGITILLWTWFGWAVLSATQTPSSAMRLTQFTLLQFAGCVVCFYAGLRGVSALRDRRALWAGLAVGLTYILGLALHQHFGGLEETRRWFEQLPEGVRSQLDTPEFRKKMLSDRVFGSFVYPNALAGGILLLLPVTLAGIGQLGGGRGFRWTLCTVLVLAGSGALYWSGSKSGWLIALVIAGLALWQWPAKWSFKVAVLTILTAVGLTLFLGKYGAYFEKGASSLAARRDYWRAAVTMIQQRPLLGYGPGTFQRQYANLKPPEAEMARLAHNDYLQQGSDSGLPAMLAYFWLIGGSFALLYRKSTLTGIRFGAWVGGFGLAMQSLSEFGLYIPGLAWPLFLFLGWLWGAPPNGIDNPRSASYPSPPKK